MITLSTLARTAAANAIVRLLDQGTVNPTGWIEIRGGPRPAAPEIPATGNLLAKLLLAKPAFATAISGTAVANTIQPDPNAGAGSALWFRVYDRDGHPTFDGDVSIIGGTGDCQLNDLTVIAGDLVSLSVFAFTIPARC